MLNKVKRKIKGSLLNKIKKLNRKNRIFKKEILDLEDKIEDLRSELKNLKDINYTISSNNVFLIEQRRKTNKKLKQLRLEIESLRVKERENQDGKKGRE